MILPWILIAAYSAFFVWSFRSIVKSSDLAGVAYATLFVYAIFPMIGYLIAPEVFERKEIYYELQAWYAFYAFIGASTVASAAMYLTLYRMRVKLLPYSLHVSSSRSPNWLYFAVTGTLCLAFAVIKYVYAERFVYVGIADEAGKLNQLIAFLHITLGSVALISWMILRSANGVRYSRMGHLVVFITAMGLFLSTSVNFGARSSIIYLLVAFLVFEFAPLATSMRRRPRLAIKIVVLLPILFWLLQALSLLRWQSSVSFHDLAEAAISLPEMIELSGLDWRLLFFEQDPLYPASNLFIAFSYNLVDFMAVLSSNLANSIAFLQHQTLANIVTRAHLGIEDRDIGYAYYLFVEGFMAVGWAGIIYNGFVWTIGMRMWQWFYTTNNAFLSKGVMCILAFMIVPVMRGQSSAFVKLLWMFGLPAIGLLLLATGLRLSVRRVPLEGSHG